MAPVSLRLPGVESGDPGGDFEAVDGTRCSRAGVVRARLLLGVLGVLGCGECARECDLLVLCLGVDVPNSLSNLCPLSTAGCERGVLLPASIPLTSRPESAARCSRRSLCLLTKIGLEFCWAIVASASLLTNQTSQK